MVSYLASTQIEPLACDIAFLMLAYIFLLASPELERVVGVKAMAWKNE